MIDRSQIRGVIDSSGGVLRLEPCWVPRSFMHPGRRLRLHPDDLYAFGAHRGGINERGFRPRRMRTTARGRRRMKGLSYVPLPDGQRLLLKAAVDAAGDLLLGARRWSARRAGTCSASSSTTWGRSRITCTSATSTRARSRPPRQAEAYYFPPQYNPTDNNYPHTFMGLEPGTTKDQVRRCLENWNTGDNGITYLSRAYRLERGSGWQIDPGILHAPVRC
jgi:hypothetical protein